MSQPRHVNVVVLCFNEDGKPEFHTCAPQVTPEQVASGAHYTLAKENAADNGYQEPMVAFDSTDPAARQLGELAAWV